MSSGHDARVRFWDIDNPGQDICCYYPHKWPEPVPLSLNYNHRELLLAVAYDDGYGVSLSYRLFTTLTSMSFYVVSRYVRLLRNHGNTVDLRTSIYVSQCPNPDIEHPVKSMVWGHGRTEGRIFASTKSNSLDGDGRSTGYHGMFDVDTGKLVNSFGETDAGAAMALCPLGEISQYGTRINLLTESTFNHQEILLVFAHTVTSKTIKSVSLILLPLHLRRVPVIPKHSPANSTATLGPRSRNLSSLTPFQSSSSARHTHRQLPMSRRFRSVRTGYYCSLRGAITKSTSTIQDL